MAHVVTAVFMESCSIPRAHLEDVMADLLQCTTASTQESTIIEYHIYRPSAAVQHCLT